MENITVFIIALIFIIAISVEIVFYAKSQKKLFNIIESKIKAIKEAVDQFSSYLDFNNRYFANHQKENWKAKYENLYNEIKNKPITNIYLKKEEQEIINTFIDYFSLTEKYRDKYNSDFIKNELEKYSTFFDGVEGRKLDDQQRTAIVTDEDNNLVIAGAGSGKTTTIIGKVNYLIDRYKIPPEEILLISFTNKSASTLAKRINIDGIEAKTFHKFGKDIVASVEGKQPSVFDEKQFNKTLSNYFKELICDKKYLFSITEYFTKLLKPAKSQFEFINQGDYFQYLKDLNFKTYKLIKYITKGKITYKMEIVKSVEECMIANFLIFNGIEYEYEAPYEYDTADKEYQQYKPDFTITQNGKRVYVEHFGISRNNDVPKYFVKIGETYEQARRIYLEKINWATRTHKHHNTTLIKTFSYEMSEDILFENLTKHLTQAGITLYPKSPEEIWKIINNAAKDEVSGFSKLIGTFITLMKSNNFSIPDLVNKNKLTQNEFVKKRNSSFIEIVKPLYERYQKHLINAKEIDFSDMINIASEYVASGKYRQKISYVIIDEFQDISIGRYQLIKAIRKINPDCKLFCVGDDWQSIYRFNGSDISLFKEFEKYFGFTVRSKIETTYRFQNPLIDLSSKFIQKNPNQVKKELKGINNGGKTNYKIMYSSSENNDDDTEALKNIFDELITKDSNIQNKKIMLLGRYSFDINRIKNTNKAFRIDNENKIVLYDYKNDEGTKFRLEVPFLTVHKAKGLEADIIILMNCNSGKYGFPSEMSDDSVLNLLLSEADQFENGEERRLFYVAMTRAKKDLYFITDTFFKSKFITELEVELGEGGGQKKCPYCISSDLVRHSGTKDGREWAFWGCSNYNYGCDYKKWEIVDKIHTNTQPQKTSKSQQPTVDLDDIRNIIKAKTLVDDIKKASLELSEEAKEKMNQIFYGQDKL